MTWLGDCVARFPVGFAFLALFIAGTAFVAGVIIERARNAYLVDEVQRLRRTKSSRSGW